MQYKVIEISANHDDLENSLNAYAQEGWRVVAITPKAYGNFGETRLLLVTFCKE